jgi:hypothetical protein
MIPYKEFQKIERAIKSGSLKLRILSEGEYAKIEKEFEQKKAQEQPRPQRVLLSSCP